MTSLEIAELTGKRHDNVMADIKAMLEELGGVLSFQDTYIHPQNGQKYPCFNLPKRECLILVSGYNIKMRAAIIDRWRELETQLPEVSTNSSQNAFDLIPSVIRAAEALGLVGNYAKLSADKAVKTLTGYSPIALLGIELVKEVQELNLTPTEIGQQLTPPLSAINVNLLLAGLGLQSTVGNKWEATGLGSKYSVLLDTGKKSPHGTPVTQLKWLSSVVALLN